MNKLIVISTLSLFLSLNIHTKAQTGSPYSQVGIGELKDKAFGQSKAMGGIGIGLRTTEHLNITNPAAYTSLDSNIVIYEVGLIGELNHLKNKGGSELKKNGNIEYFALGFRATKRWFLGIGLLNLSEVDFLTSIDEKNPYNGMVRNYYYGEGGIYRVYWTNAFEIINKQLSVGLNLAYNFGSINRVKNTIFLQDAYAYNSKFDQKTSLYGITLEGGLQYALNLNKKSILTFGATYSGEMKINKSTNVLGGTTKNSSASRNSLSGIIEGELQDTIYQLKDEKGSFTMPQEFGVGVTWEKTNEWVVGADFHYKKWSSIKYNSPLNDQFSAHLGLEFVPDKKNITNYFKRAYYRMGAYMKQSYVMLDNQGIKDYGITFGVGLPLRGSSFNIGFQFGQRGSNNKNLIKENYGILTLNLTLSDIWFLKRKYN